jgi:ABC-type protease/lipase transport system fused ATPase/permease subunit
MKQNGWTAGSGDGTSAAFVGLAAMVFFSLMVNLLAFAPPLLMLQIYERVLPTRSAPTLIALCLFFLAAWATGALLEIVRSRIAVRTGAGLSVRPGTAPDDGNAILRLSASPQILALADLPFTPVFAAALFAFDPLLGALSLAGLVALAGHGFVLQRVGRKVARTGAAHGSLGPLSGRAAQLVRAMGMGPALDRQQERQRRVAMADEAGRRELLCDLAVHGRSLRQLLQSAVLSLSAWLVIEEQLSAGAMIAASIIAARVFQPVEAIAAGWQVVGPALAALRRLPPTSHREEKIALPAEPICPVLEVRGLAFLGAPGGRGVSGLSFDLRPGHALGIIGPNGVGKSRLLDLLAGLEAPDAGSVHLAGRPVAALGTAERRTGIGYAGRPDIIFDATVAANIARLDDGADEAAIRAAAVRAGVHDRILRMSRSYDTQLSPAALADAAGLTRRLALARAVLGNPPAVYLDDPCAGLDGDGCATVARLVRAQKAAGGIAVLTARRAAEAPECDFLVALLPGGRFVLGPRHRVIEALSAQVDRSDPPRVAPATRSGALT